MSGSTCWLGAPAAVAFGVGGSLDPSMTTVLDGPDHGTLVNNGDGTSGYTPELNYNGPDSFTYGICDTEGLCAMATVNIEGDAGQRRPWHPGQRQRRGRHAWNSWMISSDYAIRGRLTAACKHARPILPELSDTTSKVSSL